MTERFTNFIKREILVSEAGESCGSVFDTNDVGLKFFELVWNRFAHFDYMHRKSSKPLFYDVDYIIKCVTADLKSEKFAPRSSQRLDSYLYIYRLLHAYALTLGKFHDPLHEFKQCLFDRLASIFVATNGKEPNLLIRDTFHLRKMDIPEHLSSFTSIRDQKMLETFFVLVKLSMQSARMIDDGRQRFIWLDTLPKVREINFYFDEFIRSYVKYQLVFEKDPIDTPEFIYLAGRIRLPKEQEPTYILTLAQLHKLVQPAAMKFVTRFPPLFEICVRANRFHMDDIIQFFQRICKHEQWLRKYLSVYASNTTTSYLWEMFVRLSKIANLRDATQEEFAPFLIDKVSDVVAPSFDRYTLSFKATLLEIPTESRSKFTETFAKIFDAFIVKQMQIPFSVYGLTRTDCKKLLKLGLEISSVELQQNATCLRLLRRLICETESYQKSSLADKLQCLFRNLNFLDEDLSRTYAPEQLIDDEWLKDFLIGTTQHWLKLDEDTYTHLCRRLSNERWTTYVWSRIMHMSLAKLANENPYDILVQLNDWMKRVHRHTYDPEDTFTLIFVGKLFDLIIAKLPRALSSLPKIDAIMNVLLPLRDSHAGIVNVVELNNFIKTAQGVIVEILHFKSKCSTYRDSLSGSFIYCFLPFIDLNEILNSVNPKLYEFPLTTEDIDAIVSLPKPRSIDRTNIESNRAFFDQFITQINEWLGWFERFADISQHIIEWLKNYNVSRSNEVLIKLLATRDDPRITLLEMRMTIESVLKLLSPFKDLRRLCDFFNCSNPFQVLDPGALSIDQNTSKYLTDVKQFHSNNTRTVQGRERVEQNITIGDRQQVQWSVVSENHPCHIIVEYRNNASNNKHEVIFEKENVPIHKHVLNGLFETQRGGQLLITIDNRQASSVKTIWYRIKSTALATCHLFHGIFNLIFDQYYPLKSQTIRESELSQILDRVFSFINTLLDGSISLQNMKELQGIFRDRNINIQEEVKKLYANRSTEQNNDAGGPACNAIGNVDEGAIKRICEWLQIYQYYSHINVILECIQKFDLLPLDTEDETIGNLRRFNGKENCSLKDIVQDYQILQQRFQSLSHQHLQLIKTARDCSNVVQMMKASNLYSDQGRRRFQELRDNLTTQFQMQERNNMILNSWIMTYTLIEPFTSKAKNFDDFVLRLSKLSNLEENSLNDIKIINDNVQIVTMWLSAEETTVLDNALITMEHLYKTGIATIHLRRLMNKSSSYQIEYSLGRFQSTLKRADEDNQGADQEESNKAKIILSMSEVDDHKRQLTFCNADVQANLHFRKALINGQLKLLQTITEIYQIYNKLEIAGHPDFQLKDEHYDVHLQQMQSGSLLADFRNHQNVRLESTIQNRIENLKLIHDLLQGTYKAWIQNLDKYRQECSLLKLFSNREIMILIILLRTSSQYNLVRHRFLKKLFSFEDPNKQAEEDEKRTIHCLSHYLRAVRIHHENLTNERLRELYQAYRIDSAANTDVCLKKLCKFLGQILENEHKILEEEKPNHENRQYLVSVNAHPSTSKQISFENDFDLNTCCILLNIFQDRLPSSHQLLWCSTTSDEEIHLFFSRIRSFPRLTFVIMDIDKMYHRLREVLLNEQDLLARESKAHGTVYYFSRELNESRKGLRRFDVPSRYVDRDQSVTHLSKLFRTHQIQSSQIQIVYGEAGIGKTHRINAQYKTDRTTCFSINDKLNLSLLISSFLLVDWKTNNDIPSIFFNISMHAPFEMLNRTLFSLFVCGCLNDASTGLIFSLPNVQRWKFIIEVPYSKVCRMSIEENFRQILPTLAIIPSSTIEEVTGANYQLFMGEEEEVVARFLRAFSNGTINRLATTHRDGTEVEVEFAKLTHPDECRIEIYNCMQMFAPDLPRNKIYELSFTKFLYRRVRFFEGHFFRWNQKFLQLGSVAMTQMIEEARSLTRINFRDNTYPRVFLVYDPEFSLHLLHGDWNHVSPQLKHLFDNQDPLQSVYYRHKDYFAECLAWLIDIRYEACMKVIEETKFILTENFAYKLFHVHERKLTKLALIIEGDTGVGKTFLLKFYSLLLNIKNDSAPLKQKVNPCILENSSAFIIEIIETFVKKQVNLLNLFLQQIKPKLLGLDNGDEEDNLRQQPLPLPIVPAAAAAAEAELIDVDLLKEIELSLKDHRFDKSILYQMWRIILNLWSKNAMDSTPELINALYDYVNSELIGYPRNEGSVRLRNLLQEVHSPSIKTCLNIFKEYLFETQEKPLFYRLLLHPGITEEQLEDFMFPISQLARALPEVEIVVFFDEVNTSSCLGLFKEMFMDGTLYGSNIPRNIFFTAAINPLMKISDRTTQVHRNDFIVHDLPQAMKDLIVGYGALESRTLGDYIVRKIAMFLKDSKKNSGNPMPSDEYFQNTLARAILRAQEFCERRLGRNSVSQREIQRCFNLIEFFWNMRYDDELVNGQNVYDPNPIRCIALSIALIYYFRLPTREDNVQRNDHRTPSREDFAELIHVEIQEFDQVIQNELERFVTTKNFVIPPGVAINQAVREHIFTIVVSIVTRTPLCIIGVPGQSKTLSFQIVLQNLQGSQISPTAFCKRLPAIDPFFCLGSKYSRSEDIEFIFERVIKREQQYEQNRINTRCVVFLDEASLPDEKKMVLKVLHPYLDECKVAFVAVANEAFDAANANRMICVYRSLPSRDDQKILAYGCLGLQSEHRQATIDERLEKIIQGLCQGYREVLRSPDIPHIFHDRDFIYMLRELRFELANLSETEERSVGEITPRSLLRALEDNFNGIRMEEFDKLVAIFAKAIGDQCPQFRSLIKEKEQMQRNIPTILRESMKLSPTRRRLYGRYKLIIDESEDESAVRLLLHTGILDADPNQTRIFRMSDFAEDAENELRNVEILSDIKLCMETGKTIVMVNTGRIHGSLYDVFNQNFSIMATNESRKIFSKVAIGPKTIDVVVHEEFQCIVHVKRSEFDEIPAPFLSRFQKYSLSVADFYSIQLRELPSEEQEMMKEVERKAQSFIKHFGKEYLYGLNSNTLYSCLLSLIKRNAHNECYLSTVNDNYTQLTIKSKPFIEQNSTDKQQCLLFGLLAKLWQLASPESIIYKLPTFEEDMAQALRENYFYQQEHLSFENFLHRLVYSPTEDRARDEPSNMPEMNDQKPKGILISTKVMVYTRTSPFVVGLNEQSKGVLLRSHDEEDPDKNQSEKVDILSLAMIENSLELQERFQTFEQDKEKTVLTIVIDTRITHQRLHIPFLRQLIDRTDLACKASADLPAKYFLVLMHSFGQELDPRSCFPSIFLHEWDYWFIDTCTPSSAFHFQKLLPILSADMNKYNEEEVLKKMIFDFDNLFDDCLWDFCARLKVNIQRISTEMFANDDLFQFYRHQTTVTQRVKCLKTILLGANQLQARIVTIYHENVSMKSRFRQKNRNSIYEICKNILCGKQFAGVTEALQSQILTSFTNFVANVLKFIVDDYGLEAIVKSSQTDKDYQALLELIDYSSFATNADNASTPTIQGPLTLSNHYSYIPQTPLYYLLRQRIKSLADDIKLTSIEKKTEEKDRDDNLRFDYYDTSERPPTTSFNYHDEDDNDIDEESLDAQFDHCRKQLMQSVIDDKILIKILSPSIVKSYTNDSIRALCTVVEKNFHRNQLNCQKTIDFVARWLTLMDPQEKITCQRSSSQEAWLLAHVYSILEHEQNDLLSLYSACRIIEGLEPNQSFYDQILDKEGITRSEARENLFQLMFEHLWRNFCDLTETDEDVQQWIYSYTMISKYYPSKPVTRVMDFALANGRIDFMNLAYLILLNEKTPNPKELVRRLLALTALKQGDIDGRNINRMGSICLKLLSEIIQTIYGYFQEGDADNSTLMIDIQQWIIATLKSSKQSSREEIICLLRFLNQSACHVSIPMKQFLFDELCKIHMENLRQNRLGNSRQSNDFWDRLSLLPIILECVAGDDLQSYQIPYHPSVITDENQHQVLLDLLFHHLQRLAHADEIKPAVIHKILISSVPKINDARLIPSVEKVFKQLKDYFLIYTTAMLLCQKELGHADQERIDNIITTLIKQYLQIDAETVQLRKEVELFCSIIINKRSWKFLLGLLESDRFQHSHAEWANTLHRLIALEQTVQRHKYLQLCHQLQFTITSDSAASIFPTLHQPYLELSQLIDQCVKNNDVAQRWTPLSAWIQTKLNTNPAVVSATEIKVMLLLKIYYDYYCNAQLALLDHLIIIIENELQPSAEELRVFRVFLQPEQRMIGYLAVNNGPESNHLNSLFRLDCNDEDELSIRHALVNLLAMILLSGKDSFLWTFAFEPLALTNTFGFGSLRSEVISTIVHYDCGCMILETGALIMPPGGRGYGSVLNVPAVYVAFFATFGAMAWHLLLFDQSVDNLYGPVLAKHAIDDKTAATRIAGDSVRTKVCHFVRARLLATHQFLQLQSNQDDASILLNRCFELFAQLSRHPDQNPWIKSVYRTPQEKLQGEQEFQNQVFYPVHQALADHRKRVNSLNLQSQIQKALQDYTSEMPILIEFQHFKTELCNPKYATLPLTVLRRLLDSFDFLKITQSIYDLSQFHLLLNRTYTQLIEQEEFLAVTLNDLFERGQRQTHGFPQANQRDKHSAIIKRGIEAVNAYHVFADGLIRPGACDETQRFQRISIQTPVHYLVETDNYDEGDIVMRILSVLVDYHNDLLGLLEQEIQVNGGALGLGSLAEILSKLADEEVSIVQIAQERMGVVALNETDCQWIEQLSRASLENENRYFPKLDTSLNFNFLYVQAHLIRSYLLLCRINYKHIQGRYQCYAKRHDAVTTTLDRDGDHETDLRLTDEWNHLEYANLNQLHNEHRLLQRIADVVRNATEDFSKVNLSTFMRNGDYGHRFAQQFQEYQIKDFPLHQIDDVCRFYEKMINNYQHAFIDAPRLLRVPLDDTLSNELDQIFQSLFLPSTEVSDKVEFEKKIQTINEFLSDLKEAENSLGSKSAQSLAEICQQWHIDNPIVHLIPREIKCENYVPLCQKLSDLRSQLRKHANEIEEKSIEQWSACFDRSTTSQSIPNSFHMSREPPSPPIIPDPPSPSVEPPTPTPREKLDTENPSVEIQDLFSPTRPTTPRPTTPVPQLKSNDYVSLVTLKIQSVSLPPSALFESSRLIADGLPTQEAAVRIQITHLDGSPEKHHLKAHKVHDQLRKSFVQKRYDLHSMAIIDQYKLCVDYLTEPTNDLLPIRSAEYRVIERTALMSIILSFERHQLNYSATSQAQISSILARFIVDQKLTFTPSDTYFNVYDQQGKYLFEDSPISQIYRSDEQAPIRVQILRSESNTSTFAEVTLTKDHEAVEPRIELFNSITTWEQMNAWLLRIGLTDATAAASYNFWNRESSNIIDEDQTIASTMGEDPSVTIDVLDRDAVMTIKLSFDKMTTTHRILNSCPLSNLLHNQRYLQQLNVEVSSAELVLALIGGTEQTILDSDELQRSVGYFAETTDAPVHFKICILIHFFRYNDTNEQQLTISHRNITVATLLGQIEHDDDEKYLASHETKIVFAENTNLSRISETTFILAKEDHTCLVSIDRSRENGERVQNHRYLLSATIGDIHKQNRSLDQFRSLLYGGDFVPSQDTRLISFLPITTESIAFMLIPDNLPVSVTITSDKQETSIQLQCASSIRIGRLTEIVCRIWKLNQRFYGLFHIDDYQVDDDFTLEEIDDSANEFQLKLVCNADLACSVTYKDRTVHLPTSNEVIALTVLQEALQKFGMSLSELEMFELHVLDDTECSISIDPELSVEIIRSDLPGEPTLIPFQLQRKED